MGNLEEASFGGTAFFVVSFGVFLFNHTLWEMHMSEAVFSSSSDLWCILEENVWMCVAVEDVFKNGWAMIGMDSLMG